MTPIPVDGKSLDWPRKVANAVNRLLSGAVQRDGAEIYVAPTISDPPTAAEVQELADAVAAISARLK